MDNRYQNQKWYVKIWRCRHYLPIIPKMLLLSFRPSFWKFVAKEIEEKNASPTLLLAYSETFNLMYSLEIGIAQSKMEYYYTWEEVRKRLKIED